jgi:hypothetical protein
MDKLLHQKMRDALSRPAGIEAAREFLQTYVSNADMNQLRAIIAHMCSVNPITVIDGLAGLEDVLAEKLPAGVLAGLVARDANRSLDDSSDEGARIWLVQLASRVREWLGDAAPPPAGTRTS